jgi:CheY-like chemotaxis protein
VVDLARSLRLESTAEGVETYEQVVALRELGCDTGQGYYFSRPQPAEAFSDLVRLRHSQSRVSEPEGGTATVTRLPLSSIVASAPLHGVRVLVCDDDERTRWVCRVALESAGAEVTEADDGDACVNIAGAIHHDVVILDLFMPRRDGLSTLPELRAKAPTSKVILFSAFPAQDFSISEMGVAGCYEKHDALGRLIDIVTEVVERPQRTTRLA